MPKGKPAPKRKAANGYKLAEPLPLGEILKDISKKEWKLGPSIGQGGFGEIYSAKEATSKSSQYPYVIKIEPHGNGPLFVEMHFYMRNGKPEDVDGFKKKKGLKTFGMPLYLGSGSHEYNGEKYRFIVMEKFGTDLWKIFLENNKIIPTTTVFKIAVQVLDVLEYIHNNGYIHGDIKGANILLGEKQNKQCYLVDFGLATKWNDDKEFKPNPKKAHDGTIEYLSRDAHLGVQTRRGDLEILAYNMIQWLGCILPWEKKLTDPVIVQKSKEQHMSSINTFIKTCFVNQSPPGSLLDFLKYLSTLKHNTNPDYKKIRKIFLSGLDSNDNLDKNFQFSTAIKKKSPIKRKSNEVTQTKKIKNSRKNETISESESGTGSESSEDEKENLDEEKIISPRGRPRKMNYIEESDEEVEKPKRKTKKVVKKKENQPKTNNLDLNGYTDAMKEIMKKKMEKEKLKGRKKKEEYLVTTNMDGFTASMREIALKKTERLAKKKKN